MVAKQNRWWSVSSLKVSSLSISTLYGTFKYLERRFYNNMYYIIIIIIIIIVIIIIICPYFQVNSF